MTRLSYAYTQEKKKSIVFVYLFPKSFSPLMGNYPLKGKRDDKLVEYDKLVFK